MWREQATSQGQKHPASGLQTKGTAKWAPSESPSSTEALFPLAKLWNVEWHHQNPANPAGSYYNGKPGPGGEAPQPPSVGNPGSIPSSKLHAGLPKLARKNPHQAVLCPSAFSLTGLQQRQPYSHSHEWTSDQSQALWQQNTFSSDKAGGGTSPLCLVWHTSTPGSHSGAAQGVSTDDKDPLLELLPSRMRGFYWSLGQTLIAFNPRATGRMA